MRMIVPSRRYCDEEWVEYIRRSTHRAEACAEQHGLSNWAHQQAQRKWIFAGKVARDQNNKWSTKLLDWTPWFRATPKRAVAHPFARWRDSLDKYAGGDWQIAAKDEALWTLLQAGYETQS